MAAQHCRSRRRLQREGLSALMGRRHDPPASAAKGFVVSPTPIVLLALVALGCAAAAPAAAQLPPPSTPTARVGSPTLAVEDTMRVALPEEIIRAPRVSLDEILKRVAEGEARRDSMMQDQVFTMLAALT